MKRIITIAILSICFAEVRATAFSKLLDEFDFPQIFSSARPPRPAAPTLMAIPEEHEAMPAAAGAVIGGLTVTPAALKAACEAMLREHWGLPDHCDLSKNQKKRLRATFKKASSLRNVDKHLLAAGKMSFHIFQEHTRAGSLSHSAAPSSSAVPTSGKTRKRFTGKGMS